jgi:hypothetical protein
LYEIQSEGQAIEGKFDVIHVSTVASIIQKWWKFQFMKYDRCKTCISQRGLLNIRILIDLQKKGCSSAIIVCGYRMDNGDASPAEAKDFFSNLCHLTSSEIHPASYPMGNGGPSPGIKRGLGMTLATHPHLVQWSRMSRS